MFTIWIDWLNLLVLLTGYWIVDLLLRREGLRTFFSRIGLSNAAVQIGLVTAPFLVLAYFWRWEQLHEFHSIRSLALILVGLLTWKATTKDVDPVFQESAFIGTRYLLVGLAIGSYFSPACLFPATFLLTFPFRLWEHHSTFPMRVLLAMQAWLMLAMIPAFFEVPLFADSSIFFFLVVTIQISHYLITALAKAWLGPKWYSWVVDNRLHHLAATAYSWGWAKFLPWSVWRKVIGLLKIFEKPMQAFAFTIELLAPLAMLHPHAAIGFSLAWALFHCGVFATSGLLFWDWIGANLAIGISVWLLPVEVRDQVFTWQSGLVCCLVMVALPLRHKLWKPIPLGWWDTPFAQRMHWVAYGESGKAYGVYNNFMCPNERLYGKVHACFMTPEKGITYHLGEVWKRELRDAIRDAGPCLEALAKVRETFGVEPKSESFRSNHVAYLQRFFHAVNEKHRKSVFPRWLRWLKAPGDQVFYWGDLPPFRGQEKVTLVELLYREEYFDGENLVRLQEKSVQKIEINEECSKVACVPEPTPKEIDDLLLGVAKGKIIDLPGFSDGYVKADDGISVNPSSAD